MNIPAFQLVEYTTFGGRRNFVQQKGIGGEVSLPGCGGWSAHWSRRQIPRESGQNKLTSTHFNYSERMKNVSWVDEIPKFAALQPCAFALK